MLALNNASVPEVNELDAAEATRLAGLAASVLVAEVDGAFAGFCWVLGPGRPYDSLNYRWFSVCYDSFVYLDRVRCARRPPPARHRPALPTRAGASSRQRARCCCAR